MKRRICIAAAHALLHTHTHTQSRARVRNCLHARVLFRVDVVVDRHGYSRGPHPRRRFAQNAAVCAYTYVSNRQPTHKETHMCGCNHVPRECHTGSETVTVPSYGPPSVSSTSAAEVKQQQLQQQTTTTTTTTTTTHRSVAPSTVACNTPLVG